MKKTQKRGTVFFRKRILSQETRGATLGAEAPRPAKGRSLRGHVAIKILLQLIKKHTHKKHKHKRNIKNTCPKLLFLNLKIKK